MHQTTISCLKNLPRMRRCQVYLNLSPKLQFNLSLTHLHHSNDSNFTQTKMQIFKILHISFSFLTSKEIFQGKNTYTHKIPLRTMRTTHDQHEHSLKNSPHRELCERSCLTNAQGTSTLLALWDASRVCLFADKIDRPARKIKHVACIRTLLAQLHPQYFQGLDATGDEHTTSFYLQ